MRWMGGCRQGGGGERAPTKSSIAHCSTSMVCPGGRLLRRVCPAQSCGARLAGPPLPPHPPSPSFLTAARGHTDCPGQRTGSERPPLAAVEPESSPVTQATPPPLSERARLAHHHQPPRQDSWRTGPDQGGGGAGPHGPPPPQAPAAIQQCGSRRAPVGPALASPGRGSQWAAIAAAPSTIGGRWVGREAGAWRGGTGRWGGSQSAAAHAAGATESWQPETPNCHWLGQFPPPPPPQPRPPHGAQGAPPQAVTGPLPLDCRGRLLGGVGLTFTNHRRQFILH